MGCACKSMLITRTLAMLLMIFIVLSALLQESAANPSRQIGSSRRELAPTLNSTLSKPRVPIKDDDTFSRSEAHFEHDKFEERNKGGRARGRQEGKNSTGIDRSVVNLYELDRKQTNLEQNELDHSIYSVGLDNRTESRSNSTLQNDVSQNITTVAPSSDLETADSRFRPQVGFSSRSDREANEHDSQSGDDLDSSSALDDESYSDGASSNLSEKKVVRELTKLLSKSMSGATDQVRVETLENLKRRQKERKAIKDSRAKLFEDLITTAINNHPERLKKPGSRRPSAASKDLSNARFKSAASNSMGLAPSLTHNTNLDPELVTDAETVMQHLQGLATAIEGNSPNSAASNSASPNFDSTGSSMEGDSEEASSSSVDGDGETNEVAGGGEERARPKKALLVPSERPLVRQFKKIKNQLSQRRKQLDQIKKLFNTELTLNPKDGSLVSKQVGSSTSSSSSRKNRYQQHSSSVGEGEESGEELPDNESIGSKRSRAAGGRVNGYRARELLTYLRDNPEILASVMAELTVDADPTSNGRLISSQSSQSDEGFYQPRPSSLGADNNDYQNLLGSSSRRTVQQGKLATSNFETDQPPWHQSPALVGLNSETIGRRGPATRVVHEYESFIRQPKELTSRYSASSGSPPNLLASAPRSRSAENLLLETLRERQLMNLARLDLVLAERQAASSNRSSILSQLATSNLQPTKTLNRTDTLNSYQRMSQDSEEANSRVQRQSQLRDLNQRQDDDLLHHFMLVNQNSDDASAGSRGSFLNQVNYHQAPLVEKQTNAADLTSGHSNSDDNKRHSQYQQSNSTALRNYNMQQPQQQPNSLGRFRDWRDVSQSEASSWQHDKTNSPNANVTWMPYDLTTGGSSSPVQEAQSTRESPAVLHPNNRHQQQTQMQMHLNQQPTVGQVAGNFTSELNTPAPALRFDSLDNQQQRQQSQQLPPPPPPPPQTQSPLERQQMLPMNQPIGSNGRANRMFPPHPPAAEPDLTTIKLSSGRDDMEPRTNTRLSHREDSFRRADYENGGESGRSDAVNGDEMSGASRNPAPVNYFSSYEQEPPFRERKRYRYAGSSVHAERRSDHRRLHRRDRPSISLDAGPETDDMGAIWA